jgi:hypothetical protein
MKYLKKFNEELKPSTYRRAASKLKKMGGFNIDRAKNLTDWAEKREADDSIIKWEKNIEEFSKFGKFKLNIANKFTGDFYLDLNFSRDSFLDEYAPIGEGDDEDYVRLGFFIGAIPVDEETRVKTLEIVTEDDFSNGFIWSNMLSIELKIIPGSYEITDISIEDYDVELTGGVELADRASAGRLRSLLVSLFENPNLNYPSGYNDYEYFYEMFESLILAGAGLSSDLGMTMEQLAEYIKKFPASKLIKK